jgi:hypothetical protein
MIARVQHQSLTQRHTHASRTPHAPTRPCPPVANRSRFDEGSCAQHLPSCKYIREVSTSSLHLPGHVKKTALFAHTPVPQHPSDTRICANPQRATPLAPARARALTQVLESACARIQPNVRAAAAWADTGRPLQCGSDSVAAHASRSAAGTGRRPTLTKTGCASPVFRTALEDTVE